MKWYNYIKEHKCIEPVKRRHGTLRPEWQSHRFAIKGGISWREAMMRDMSEPNPWLEQMAKGLKTPDRKWFKLNAD